MFDALLTVAATTTLFWTLDAAISWLGYLKPYYAVHTLHNAAIVALAAPDLYTTLTDFHRLDSYPVTWSVVYLCFGLHIYHILKYWRTLHFDDWLHHALMIGIALPLGCTIPAGSLMGFNLFFTTGLPGGISYGLLFANRNGWVSKATEKAVSAPVHVWIRSPGCTALAALTLAHIFSASSVWSQVGGTVIAALTYWNGQYFMEQVVRSDSKQAVVLLDKKREMAAAGALEAGRFFD